jgi:hypothetical protein
MATLSDTPKQCHAIHARHLQVADNQADFGGTGAKALKSLVPACHLEDQRFADAPQHLRKTFPLKAIVVNDQYTALGSAVRGLIKRCYGRAHLFFAAFTWFIFRWSTKQIAESARP